VSTEDDRRYEPVTAPEPATLPSEHPRDTRSLLGKLLAPLVVLVGVVLKFGVFILKFFGVFLAVGGYALIWGWKFAVGFVLLILVHELGHFVEARRRGFDPALPVFIPFLGAYVAIRDARMNPWQSAWISLAGPISGGLGAAVCWVVGEQQGSQLLQALGYVGFLLNLFNLIPIGFLDGGSIWRSIRTMRLGGTPGKANVITLVYFGLAAALLLGMVGAHVPQHRL
jgi:Zn-dependent protease